MSSVFVSLANGFLAGAEGGEIMLTQRSPSCIINHFSSVCNHLQNIATHLVLPVNLGFPKNKKILKGCGSYGRGIFD